MTSFVKLNFAKLKELTEDLKNSPLTGLELAKKYGLSNYMVSCINTGKAWHRDEIEYPIRKNKIYKCSDCGKEINLKATRCVECSQIAQRTVGRPNKDDLLKEVALNGFEATGRNYGVTGNAVKKWMKAYDLPHLIKDVKELYRNCEGAQEKGHQNVWGNITMTDLKEKKEHFFNSTGEAAKFLLEKKISEAKYRVICNGINRALSGSRQSYLGFVWKGEKLNAP